MTTPAPSPENGYTVDATMDMTAGLFNGIFGSIHDRLVAREELEGDFEALIAQGTSAALALVQENVAPQLAALQEQIQEAADAVNEIIDNGAAPNSLLLGGQLPAFYLNPANFSAEAFIKEFLAAGTASAARTAIGARSEMQVNDAISTAIAALVNSSPEALDTLQELAAALGNDANFATTVTTALAGKVAKAGDTMTGGLGLPFAELPNAAAPSNPAADKTRLYVKPDGKLAHRNSAGTETVLGEVAFASQAEAEAGTDTTKSMNALRTAQAISKNRGVASAWVNFNGTGTVAIRDSFNVSSITDNGVGSYTVNFATALSSADFAVAGAAQAAAAGDFANATVGIRDGASRLTTSKVDIAVRDGTAAGVDRAIVTVIVLGGK